MTKAHVARESLLATILTIIITFAVSFIPLKFEFSKAIRQEFLGFDIYDLYYSGKHLKHTQKDPNIVLIEIGEDRAAIAGQINLINSYSPSVIGIDAVFEKEGDMPAANDSLINAINKAGNIVFASRVDIDGATKQPILVHNFFEKGHHYPSGYINFLGNQFSVLRTYPPFFKTGDSTNPAFTSAIIRQFSPSHYDALDLRDNKTEVINYKGNLPTYMSISKEQLAEYHITGQLGDLGNALSGKIVLLGYFIKQPPLVMDDLHFSPLNEQIAGKSFPDIYGVVVHANILSMLLSKDYIEQAPEWVSYLLASAIIYLFLFYMLSRYLNSKKHPAHGWFLLIQFLLIVFMLYAFLQLFSLFHLKIPLLPIMIAMVLCVELLGVYRGIALWMSKKFHFVTVFNHKHIV